MIRLRARGIYALPDGDEFVIQAVFRGGYLLYRREPWEFFGAYAYENPIQPSRFAQASAPATGASKI